MMGKLSQLPKEKCKDKFLVQSCQYEGNIPAEDKFDVSEPRACDYALTRWLWLVAEGGH